MSHVGLDRRFRAEWTVRRSRSDVPRTTNGSLIQSIDGCRPTWDALWAQLVDVRCGANLVRGMLYVAQLGHDASEGLAHALVDQRVARRRGEAEGHRRCRPAPFCVVRRQSGQAKSTPFLGLVLASRCAHSMPFRNPDQNKTRRSIRACVGAVSPVSRHATSTSGESGAAGHRSHSAVTRSPESAVAAMAGSRAARCAGAPAHRRCAGGDRRGHSAARLALRTRAV
jgi:hypothetical protein